MTNKTRRIIIIDDDPAIREAFKDLFNGSGYDTVVYSSGEPVLNNEFEVPGLFIIDKQLSGVDGMDICRFLKDQPQTRHVPVIMLSASPGVYRLAKLAGADDALEKPFRINDLQKLVAKYLDTPATAE